VTYPGDSGNWNNTPGVDQIFVAARAVATNGSMWVVGGGGNNQLIWSSTNARNLDAGWVIESSSTKHFSGGNVYGIAYGRNHPMYNSKNGIDWKSVEVLPNIDVNSHRIINKYNSNRYLLINRDIYDFSNNIYIDAGGIVQPILPNVDNSLSFVGTNNLGFELSKNTNTNVNYTIRINNSIQDDWSYCKVEYYNA